MDSILEISLRYKERIMTRQWIDPASCRSLVVLVESVTAPLLMQHASPVCLELDIDASLEIPADPQKTADLIRALVNQALAEMPRGGDLVVTACPSGGQIELEIADSGCDIEDRSRRLPLAAAAIGADLKWQNCPQGGGAVTITFGPQNQSRRMAA
jgi:hypothetical protein